MVDDYYLEKSNRKNKKYMVHHIVDNKIKTIHFGDNRYDSFETHGDEERKKRYEARHKNEDWDNLQKPAAFSKWILWNKPTLKASIKDMEKRDDIKIHII